MPAGSVLCYVAGGGEGGRGEEREEGGRRGEERKGKAGGGGLDWRAAFSGRQTNLCGRRRKNNNYKNGLFGLSFSFLERITSFFSLSFCLYLFLINELSFNSILISRFEGALIQICF